MFMFNPMIRMHPQCNEFVLEQNCQPTEAFSQGGGGIQPNIVGAGKLYFCPRTTICFLVTEKFTTIGILPDLQANIQMN